ncbi:MAG: beta-lactamase family protein, partial [Bacteroidales bacterium]|nr:beta-lactamase family protein [Bacteroidales bacterium]
MPENILFDLASLTKTFAMATALAICMDKGLIEQSMPFVHYLPIVWLIEISTKDMKNRFFSCFPFPAKNAAQYKTEEFFLVEKKPLPTKTKASILFRVVCLFFLQTC